MEDMHEMTAEFPPIDVLLPHSAPMVLLDRVVGYADDRITCQMTVGPDGRFIDDGTMSASVSVELMAQAMAAYAGYSGYQDGEDARIAFLLSCRDLQLGVDAFAVDDVLEISASPAWVSDSELGAFDCAVRRDGQTVAEGRFNVYRGSLDSLYERKS